MTEKLPEYGFTRILVSDDNDFYFSGHSKMKKNIKILF